MVVDIDDHHPGNDAMPWMLRLKEINPKFKATLFAVPGYDHGPFWDSHPDWIELAMHGWFHPDPYESAHWDCDRIITVLDAKPSRFVKGWKSPGWQTSDDVYKVLLARDWWIADQHLEDGRRPADLPTYFYEDGSDRWHGHVQNVCGNGLEERWDELVERVAKADSFQFCSESLSLSPHAHDQRKREVPA